MTETVVTRSTKCRRIEADLVESARYARRQPCVMGTKAYPTKWDEAHAYLDLLLADWEATAEAVE